MSLNQAISDASSASIQRAAQALKADCFPNVGWLNPNNRYATDTIRRIKTDCSANCINALDIAGYIAASVTLHCFDGWSFLTHATSCLLDGDASAAVHMAYYAEIRAVMSLLASDGIGVFSGKHIWLDNSGNTHEFDGSTHDVVRDGITKWAAHPTKTSRLLDMLFVNGKSIAEWLMSAGYSQTGANTGELARDWLQTWSLDLAVLNQDHEVRNEASYRPQGFFNPAQPQRWDAILPRVVEFWRGCEPSGLSRFSTLDLHLLREALRRAHRSLTPQSVFLNPHATEASYTAFVRNTLRQIGFEDQQTLKNFLCRHQDPRHAILEEAQWPGLSTTSGLRPLAVIARAILLLRLASAACDDLLQNSRIGDPDIEFWWKRIGLETGLWELGQEPDQITDLWADIQETLEIVDSWMANTITASKTIYKAKRELSLELSYLRDFHRVGLWAVGL